MPFVEELLNYKNNVFFETGTHHGDTIFKIANSTNSEFHKIMSLELSDIFFDMCKKRFENNEKIVLYKGNSKCDLLNIIKDINTPITFWLDSHWSGCDNVGCDSEVICPIIYELEQIKQHSINTHTIMIDDIHLMNGSNDRYLGFPVSVSEILKKIYEINPNYTIKYYDDEIEKNDILVAFIDIIPEKICVHKYLSHSILNDVPPGFADFLRGTIALYNFSKKYNYKLLFDSDHKIYKYLQPNINIINNNPYNITIEAICPLQYHYIYDELDKLFASKQSFSVLTNSLYKDCNTGELSNFGNISNDCKLFLQNILRPTQQIENKINYLFNNIYNINKNEYFELIQLRCGDEFIYEKKIDTKNYILYYNKIINKINSTQNIKYILISDSSEISKRLKIDIPQLYYWDNNKIHLGNVKFFTELVEESTFDTLVDFFIMSYAKKINVINNSGFSKIVSLIYNINYEQL